MYFYVSYVSLLYKNSTKSLLNSVPHRVFTCHCMWHWIYSSGTGRGYETAEAYLWPTKRGRSLLIFEIRFKGNAGFEPFAIGSMLIDAILLQPIGQ